MHGPDLLVLRLRSDRICPQWHRPRFGGRCIEVPCRACIRARAPGLVAPRGTLLDPQALGSRTGRPRPSSGWLWTVSRSSHLWSWGQPAGACPRVQQSHSSRVGAMYIIAGNTIRPALGGRPRPWQCCFCVLVTCLSWRGMSGMVLDFFEYIKEVYLPYVQLAKRSCSQWTPCQKLVWPCRHWKKVFLCLLLRPQRRPAILRYR